MKTSTLKKIAIIILLFVGYSWVSAQQGDAELELRPSVTEAVRGDEFTVNVVLKNPGQGNIISVRSWLEYDPSVLEGVGLETGESPFTLSAPGEDTISAGEGRVKIGRSNIMGGVSDLEVTVATVRFRVLAANAVNSTIDFYDYQVSELGHTNVNIIDGGFPLNILSEEPESIQINLNPGATAPPAVEPPPVVVAPEPPPALEIGGGFSADLIRPMNLKANTGFGYVDLKWDAVPDPDRIGFNVYYGKTSGIYLRRRSIGSFDNYRLTGLNNNETYYLAVTAYDQLNRESDYSNEVGIIVNQPLSSTAPFEGLLQQVIAKIPTQPQNGPLVGWMIFSSIGLAGAVIYRRKK